MPLYPYECETCGPFQAWARMDERLKRGECPCCGIGSPRAVSAPFITRMNAAAKKAHARNEKSAYEPMVMSRKELEKSGPRRHAHSHPNHGCSGARHPRASRLEKDYRVHTAPDRPWLIGH